VNEWAGERLPSAARAAAAEVPSAWTALEAALVFVRTREPEPERGRSHPLVPNPDVVDLLPAFDLTPSGGQKVAMAARGVLAKLVGVRDLHVETLDPNFLVVRHAPQGSRRPNTTRSHYPGRGPGRICRSEDAVRETDWNELAAQLAVDSIRSSTAAGSGHPTSSLSAAHLLAVL
jgi:hypothetical protein